VNDADHPSLQFDWPVAYATEQWIRQQVSSFLERNGFARQLAARMRDETATDFFEWIDHLTLPSTRQTDLVQAGFVKVPLGLASDETPVYECPRTTLPRVVLAHSSATAGVKIALRTESVADFLARHNLHGGIEGEPLSRYRRRLLAAENGTRLAVIERRGYRGFAIEPRGDAQLRAVIASRELWQTRPRHFGSEAEGFAAANQVLDRVLGLVDPDLACHLFFEVERAYWEDRNRAARLQKHRQDQLGLGWANHDHHTYRCSRAHFADLMRFLLRLGFLKRERYYAGAEAGWGAQICEQPVAGIVVFADVDLLPEETSLDFTTHPLPASPSLGTVGLWVGLHGESFLQAGMHHLEARFDFLRLRDQLENCGVNSMKPFSDLPFLRQAFTQGETWPVRPERAERLYRARLITAAQVEAFRRAGAVGSHLENLERRGGFKGFNQKSVSAIIALTDPRQNL